MDDLSNRINFDKLFYDWEANRKIQRMGGARIMGNCSVISHAMYDVKFKVWCNVCRWYSVDDWLINSG